MEIVKLSKTGKVLTVQEENGEIVRYTRHKNGNYYPPKHLYRRDFICVEDVASDSDAE